MMTPVTAPRIGGPKGESQFLDDAEDPPWDTVAIERPSPGRVERALFCDESGIAGNQKHYGFGALIMGYQRRGDFARKMAELRKLTPHPDDEVKWNKGSAGNLGFYKQLIDYFF